MRNILLVLFLSTPWCAIGQVNNSFDPIDYCIKNEYLFRMQVSQFYPLPESLIIRFEDDWSWNGLSKNERLAWTPEIIAHYKEKWTWHELLQNPGVIWTKPLIEKNRHQKEFDWYYISRNPSLPVSDSLLWHYSEQLFWPSLCQNSAFLKQKKIAQRYKKYCDALPDSEPYQRPPADRIDTYLKYGDAWKKRSGFWEAAQAIPVELETIQNGQIQQLDLALLKKFPDFWDWYGLGNSTLLPWTAQFIDDHSSFWNYGYLGQNAGIYEKIFAPFLTDSLILEIMQRLNPPGQTPFYMLTKADDAFGIIPGVTIANDYTDSFYNTNLQFDRLSDSLAPVNFILGGIYEPPLRFADLHDWGHNRPFRAAAITVSQKVKGILERFNIPPHRFHPVEICIDDQRFGRDTGQYFIFHIAECDFKYLDYNQVKFHWAPLSYQPGQRIKNLGASIPRKLISASDYLDFQDSIRLSGPPFPHFEAREYIWNADFDIIACRAEYSLSLIWVSEDVKRALEAAGVSGIAFKKVRETHPRMLGVETTARRLRNDSILAQVQREWYGQLPERDQRTVTNFKKSSQWRDSVLAQKGIIKKLRKQHPLPATTDPVERKLREKELEWDVLVPDSYRNALIMMKFPTHQSAFRGYDFLYVDRVIQVGPEWHNNYPFTVRAILIAENGVGDYLGYLLMPESAYELDETVYEFWHETGEIKPIGKL